MGAEGPAAQGAAEASVKPGGIKWLRFFSKMRKSSSSHEMPMPPSDWSSIEAQPQISLEQSMAIDHGYAAMPQLALPAPGPEAQLRRTVAETLATSYESPSGKQMPAELLDEALPETMGDLAGLLPPLPRGHSRLPSSRSGAEEPAQEQEADTEAVVPPAVRPSTFRRSAGHSVSSSRPTTAGEESAGTSRQSAKSSWREEWTPGKAPELVGQAPDQPAPPPAPCEATTVPDPNFALALKRASESANAKSATVPALGHRRWSKGSSSEELPASDAAASASAVLPAQREGSKEAGLQRGFSDLALSFASLDETL